MNAERNTCSFCRAETQVLRQYLHADKKPSVGDGFEFVYFCAECGLKEQIIISDEVRVRREIEGASKRITQLRNGAMDEKQFLGSVSLIIEALLGRIAPKIPSICQTQAIQENTD